MSREEELRGREIKSAPFCALPVLRYFLKMDFPVFRGFPLDKRAGRCYIGR